MWYCITARPSGSAEAAFGQPLTRAVAARRRPRYLAPDATDEPLMPRRPSAFGVLAPAALLLLAACGDGAEDAVPEGPSPVAPASDTADAAPTLETPSPAAPADLPEDAPVAAISDVLGTFEGTVHGLAVWEHPTTPYLGSVVAANGAAGLVLIPLDPEVAPRTLPGTFDGPVAVAYRDDGDSVIVATRDGEAVTLLVADDRTLTETDRGAPADLDVSSPPRASVRGAEGSTVLTLEDGRLFAPGPEVHVRLAREGEADEAPLRLLAAGSGNFGGVYRDGVVAVLDDRNRLKLVPWSSVARAIGAPVESVSLRPETAATDPFLVRPTLPELPELPASSRPGGANAED